MSQVSVNLCGTLYRVSRPEPWAAVFSEETPVCGRPRRFMLHRYPGAIWQFVQVEGWGDTPCHHIVRAYEWCKARIGGDHDQQEKVLDYVRPHRWKYDEGRRITCCDECGLDMSDGTVFQPCQGRAGGGVTP